MITLLGWIANVITQAIWLTPLRAWRFRRTHPTTPILAIGFTKAIQTSEDEDVRRGMRWVTARRATLVATSNGVVCGDWVIPVSSIRRATLLRVTSLFGAAYVLKISAHEGRHYQFGLQYDPAWERKMPFPLTVEQGRIKTGPLSLALRIIALLLVLKWVAEFVWR